MGLSGPAREGDANAGRAENGRRHDEGFADA